MEQRYLPKLVAVHADCAEYYCPLGVGVVDPDLVKLDSSSSEMEIPRRVNLDPAKIAAAQAWSDELCAAIVHRE